MEEAGIDIEENQIQKPGRDDGHDLNHVGEKSVHDAYHGKSISELETLLDEALRNEDYMKAAQIRDEIDQRK